MQKMSFLFQILLLLCYKFCMLICQEVKIQAELSTGNIEGFLVRADGGAKGFAFLGIPYAQPPLGRLRFAPPAAVKAWPDVLQCRQYKPACWQIHTALDGIFYTGIEDCLYVNVFAGLDCSANSSCPVLYYIHGGGYDYDTPSAFPPKILVENFASHGLVMVTVQYRLNAFGFWSTGTEEANGNYGMQDMIAGLQWVKKEIRAFGGDPSQVTIMGHSSGGYAVSSLTLSPKTEGLIDRAIMMSGTVLAGSNFQNDLDFYWNLAEELGCAETWQRYFQTLHAAVTECMRNVSADTLGKKFLDLQAKHDFHTGPRNDGQDGLFPRSLNRMIAERRPVDSLTGTTVREMTALNKNASDVTYQDVLTLCETLVKNAGYQHEALIIRECQRQYVWSVSHQSGSDPQNATFPNGNFWVSQAERLKADHDFHAPCYKEAVSLRSNGATVYLYSFDYLKTGFELETPYHSFDLTYILGLHPFPFDARDVAMRKVYSGLFANFAKHGTPTLAREIENITKSDMWTPLETRYSFNYYSIDIPHQTMKTKYHMDGVIFWNYVVPALENVDSIVWGSVQQLRSSQNTDGKMGNFAQVESGAEFAKGNENTTDQKESSNRHWRGAFWITFTVLILTVVTAAATFVVMYCRHKRARRFSETTSLLGNVKSSYETFF